MIENNNKRVVKYHPNIDKEKVKKMKESFQKIPSSKPVKKTSK